jgi:hypothetical protein
MQEEPSVEVDTIEGLSRTEHLFVWALRAIAVGHGECPLLHQTFSAACGWRGGPALASYFVLVRYIGNAARRPLRLHAPGCASVSPDEMAVVGLVAAAQASLNGADGGLLRMRLDVLLDEHAQEAGRSAARALAEIIADSGHVLPVRIYGGRDWPDAGEPGLRTVH